MGAGPRDLVVSARGHGKRPCLETEVEENGAIPGVKPHEAQLSPSTRDRECVIGKTRNESPVRTVCFFSRTFKHFHNSEF